MKMIAIRLIYDYDSHKSYEGVNAIKVMMSLIRNDVIAVLIALTRNDFILVIMALT